MKRIYRISNLVADGAVRNIHVIKFFQVEFDIFGGYTLIYSKDSMYIIESIFLPYLGLWYFDTFDKLRFIFTVTVTGNGNIHVTITGMHGFWGMTIAAVVGVLVVVIVLGITKFFIQYFLQVHRHHVPHNGIHIGPALDANLIVFEIFLH